jgi:hypothetical protein
MDRCAWGPGGDQEGMEEAVGEWETPEPGTITNAIAGG